jgi:hypothetical protein
MRVFEQSLAPGSVSRLKTKSLLHQDVFHRKKPLKNEPRAMMDFYKLIESIPIGG